MKNEPVAWTNKDELAKYRPIIAEKEYSIHFPIPLYTHPVKEHFEDEPQAEELHEIMQSNAELTDEEIEKIKQALTIAMGCTLELSPCAEEFCKQEQLPWLEATERLAKEALAILRKASEK